MFSLYSQEDLTFYELSRYIVVILVYSFIHLSSGEKRKFNNKIGKIRNIYIPYNALNERPEAFKIERRLFDTLQ